MHFPSCCWISPPSVALWPGNSATSFPSRASTAFLTRNWACGKGVGREEGVGCVLGSCCSFVPQSVFSLFAWLPVFSHHCSLKQQAASSKESRGWDGRSLWRQLQEIMVQALEKDLHGYVFLCCDPVVVYHRSSSLRRWCLGVRVLLRTARLSAARVQQNC